MAGTRVSARSSARSSPRSSPRSARSTPRATKPTPLKASAKPSTPTRKPPAKGAKTSPYFAGGKGKTKTEAVSDEDEDLDEATGMTESEPDSTDSDSEDAFDPPSDEEEEELDAEEEEEEEEVDSDFLDEEDVQVKKSQAKRKSTGSGGTAAKKTKSNGTSSTKKGDHEPVEGYEDEDDEDHEIELEEGQEIAGRIYPAPKTGLVPPGRISQNTLNFLKNLQIPERNDREWFRSHEPAFRLAEKEWKAFVGLVQLKFHEADNEIPLLPPKDVIHRIYRDVRFSSDKTPYKKSFSLSTSRGGRKGAFAGYHLSISPNGRSILACGIWQPEKNQLASIRHRFFTEPQRFRDEISKPEFVKLFGQAKPDKSGRRQNVFGHDDALKVAPKGVDKEHKDIDLLKLRSVAVVHHFTDDEVISLDFQEKVKEVVAVMAPFAHLLNDFISLPTTNNDDEDNDA